jgi:hypothetical protein
MTNFINVRVVGGVVGTLLLLIAIFSSVTNLDSSHIMVIQSISGELTPYTEPGPRWNFFGKPTFYPRQAQYVFCSRIDVKTEAETQCDNSTSPAKRVRFSEGGHAWFNGAVNWNMPLDKESIIQIHKQFGSAEAVQNAAVGKTLDSAVYFSGPMMSSTESSGSRRGELVHYIDDQAEHGIYVTEAKETVIKDLSGDKQTVLITSIIKDKSGLPTREQGSLLEKFKISLQPISINELKYSQVVETQIASRQASTTAVQLAMASSLQAEQQAKTAEATGRANAATAKWAQEVVKATVVTKAQQDLEVATLEAKTAEQFKHKLILEGEGVAAKARLIMQANGALEQKLAAYVEVNKAYAVAISTANPGAWVSTTSMGNSSNGGGGAAAGLVELLMAKTAHDISLDTAIVGKKSS